MMLYVVIMRFDFLRGIEAATMAEVHKLQRVDIDNVLKLSPLSDANAKCSEKLFSGH